MWAPNNLFVHAGAPVHACRGRFNCRGLRATQLYGMVPPTRFDGPRLEVRACRSDKDSFTAVTWVGGHVT